MHKSILFLVFIISAFTNAQAPNYDDLLLLYADGNYPKLIKAAETYCKYYKTKSDPFPHMWVARGYYKLSLDSKYSDDQRNEYLHKATNKLKDCMLLDTNNQAQTAYEDFFNFFKKELAEQIIYEVESNQPSISWITEYYKIVPNSIGIKYVEGYYEALMNNEPCAYQFWKEADSLLASVQSIPASDIGERYLLLTGVYHTFLFLEEHGQPEKAKQIVLNTVPYFKDDSEFNTLFEDILK